ncbi:MAG: PorV/PorQ family protein [candidate division Zixibacteria bacterium]|nr:PorV/PorQ family protein [candidate division Zixibacteria bacterium]
MPKKLIAIIALVFVVFSVRSLDAVEGKGGQGGAFLRIPVGARPAGMGNAFVSISDDANAMYFNPGALYQIKGFTFGTMWSLMSMDRNHYQGSFIYSNKRFGSFGLMIGGFQVSNIDGRDKEGKPTGEFKDSEMAFSVGYGRQLFRFLGLGASFKYLNHSLKDKDANGLGFDLGAHSRIEIANSSLSLIRVGISISNLGAKLKWNTDSSHEDEIPTTLRFGAGFDLTFDRVRILLALEGSQTTDESFKFHGGIETYLYKTLGLRFGLNAEDISFGASLKYNLLQFDYAFCPDVLEEGATSKIGIQVEF